MERIFGAVISRKNTCSILNVRMWGLVGNTRAVYLSRFKIFNQVLAISAILRRDNVQCVIGKDYTYGNLIKLVIII